MTSDEIREIYGNDFLNELSLFLHDLTGFDDSPERLCKRLIEWLNSKGYRIITHENLAWMMGGSR